VSSLTTTATTAPQSRFGATVRNRDAPAAVEAVHQVPRIAGGARPQQPGAETTRVSGQGPILFLVPSLELFSRNSGGLGE
jgi:hypothetical protein